MGKNIIPLYKQLDVYIEDFNPKILRQQLICQNCQWCCRYDVFKVPNDEALEVYYIRGRSLIWEPKLKQWFVLEHVPCTYISSVEGCLIYKKRPEGCRNWMCPYPDGSIWKKMCIYIEAAERILKVKFGNKNEFKSS